MILAIGLLLALVLVRVSARAAALLALLAIMSLFVGGWLAYDYRGLLFDPIYPALAIFCLLAVATFYVYRRVEVQRGEIRRAFSRYVSPDVVNELIANPGQARARRRGARSDADVLRRAKLHHDLRAPERRGADALHQRIAHAA